MSNNYDLIVIGAGHNGLTTAGMMARKGKKKSGGNPNLLPLGGSAAAIAIQKKKNLHLAHDVREHAASHGACHEDCTVAIAKRLGDELTPQWLRIGGYWYPRGGMPIDVFYQSGPPPADLWLPDQGVQPYRGRG